MLTGGARAAAQACGDTLLYFCFHTAFLSRGRLDLAKAEVLWAVDARHPHGHVWHSPLSAGSAGASIFASARPPPQVSKANKDKACARFSEGFAVVCEFVAAHAGVDQPAAGANGGEFILCEIIGNRFAVPLCCRDSL